MTINRVVLSGKQGSGKTTTAKAISAWATWNNHKVITMKFADPLYEMHKAVKKVADNYEIPMAEKDGLLLQLLGTDWGRKQFGEDVWVNCLTRDMSRLESRLIFDSAKGIIFIIDDCRFENEFKSMYNALRIRLTAPEDIRKARCSSWRENTNHISETALDQFEAEGRFDLVLDTHELWPEQVAARIINKMVPK